MPAPFAALEARVNSAVIDRLSNREASFTPESGGVPRVVSGMYEAQYGMQLEQMVGDSSPAFTTHSILVADAAPGAQLLLHEVRDAAGALVHAAELFEVVEPMPDGAGFTVLRLRSA